MSNWWERLLILVKTATDVTIATYMYDDPDLHTALCKRLRENKPFSLSLVLDRDTFLHGASPRHERRCIEELQRLGAGWSIEIG